MGLYYLRHPPELPSFTGELVFGSMSEKETSCLTLCPRVLREWESPLPSSCFPSACPWHRHIMSSEFTVYIEGMMIFCSLEIVIQINHGLGWRIFIDLLLGLCKTEMYKSVTTMTIKILCHVYRLEVSCVKHHYSHVTLSVTSSICSRFCILYFKICKCSYNIRTWTFLNRIYVDYSLKMNMLIY